MTARRVLLISNSTLHGSGYLDHAEPEIRSFLDGRTRVLFFPYAMHDRDGYAARTRRRFSAMGCELRSGATSPVSSTESLRESLEWAEAIFVGGGNTFRLLDCLHRFSLLEPIRARVDQGSVYIGSSAGSIVACPTLRTTKDMPIVQPPSFHALGLVPFQISPHYLDPDPSSTHMGETQEERINQFLEENDARVVGLREGAMLRIEQRTVKLLGCNGARIFERGRQPIEARPGERLDHLLG